MPQVTEPRTRTRSAARKQTCNARASRRPCDVRERACRAARQPPFARRVAAVALQIAACSHWLRGHERLRAAYEASRRSRSPEGARFRQHSIRRATPEPAVGRVTSTRGRAEQRGKRRPHDALRPSLWKSLPAVSGSDAVSDFMRRMERPAGHGAKNERASGSAASDVQRQSQPSAA